MPSFNIDRIRNTLNPELFLDVRAEMNILFFGDGSHPGMSFDVILRRVDKSQKCSCWDPLKLSGDTNCAKCSGTTWLTYDRIEKSAKKKFFGGEEFSPPGQIEFDSASFYFLHTVGISEDDTIIEVETDDLGKINSPVKYIKKFTIRDLEIYRANNGRVEYKRAFCNHGE